MARIDVQKLTEQARAAAATAAPPAPPAGTPKGSAAKPADKPAGKTGEDESGKRSTKPVQKNIGTGTQGDTKDHTGKLDRSTRLPLTNYQHRLLKRRAADDDVETTVRVRAMIELYDTDERWQAAVDKLARQRASELVRHRWPTKQGQ